VVVDIALLLLSRREITATVKVVLATTERNPECGSRIIPARDALVRTHHAAGSAFQTSCVFEVHLVILEPVATRRTYDETNLSGARCTDGLINHDMGMAFIDAELVQGKEFFRA
jgi:hypothetical protein